MKVATAPVCSQKIKGANPTGRDLPRESVGAPLYTLYNYL